MIENVGYDANINPQALSGDKRITPAFKGGYTVDTTPAADTYQSTGGNSPETQGDPLTKLAYLLPTWYVLNKSSKLFDKSCGGEYDKSLLGRLGSFGDRISETKVVKNGFVNNIKSYGGSIKKNIQNFIDKHPILSAMDKTASKPENKMVVTFTETQTDADIKEASEKLKNFIDKTPKSLKDAGASNAEIEKLKEKYGTDIFGRIKNKKAAIQEFQLMKTGGDGIMTTIANREVALSKQLAKYENMLKALPKDDPLCFKISARIQNIKHLKENYKTSTLRNLKMRSLDLSAEDYEKIQKEPAKNAKMLESALEKGKETCPKLSESFNKLKSIHAPKTALGKLFPKLAKLGMRGLTFGGGTINTLFIAYFLSDAVKNTVDAPKEQKTGTIAAGLLDAMSWVVSMPLATGVMYKLAGIQNTGLSKDRLEKFRNAQKTFNADVKAGKYTNKADYLKARSEVEALRKVSGRQSRLTKAAKGFGKFLGIGLEQYKPFKESTENLKGSAKIQTWLKNIGRSMPNFLRNCAGYPLRFGLYMFVFAPIVEKLFSGATSAIFGKPYDPEKAEEEEKNEAAKKALLYSGPAIVPNPRAEYGVGTTDLNILPDSNLVKQKVIGTGSAASDQTAANKPFIPPVNSYQAPDPNKSEYDTVPHNYVPKIDLNNPFPYTDPMTNPYADKNYDSAQKLSDRCDKLADEAEAFLNEK